MGGFKLALVAGRHALSFSTIPARRAMSSSTLTSASPTNEIASNASSSVTELVAGASKWTAQTKRTGVLAVKKGMTCLWDQSGKRWPVTVLHLDNVQIIQQKVNKTHPLGPHYSVTVGCSDHPKRHRVHSAQLGTYDKAGTPPKRRLVEFPVTADAIPGIGTKISAAHFVPGQHVDVRAISVGKGFQGVMKRWGFKGLGASHGVSVKHRSAGSTGQHDDPGRVFPGKKMAGRMGGKFITTQNLMVHRIDTTQNVIYVRGAVPGPPGGFVQVKDAVKKVGWVALARARTGLDSEGEVLEGIVGFPMPVGDEALAATLPREIEYGAKPWVSRKRS